MHRFLKLLCLFITFNHAQVVPYYQPFSHIYPEIHMPASLLNTESNDFYLDFRENAQITIVPYGFIYRMILQFDSVTTGYLSITDWHVPRNAMLFVFNDEESYTGPYLSENEESFVSGRFISNQLTLEYFAPINSDFSGDFKIDRILPDYVPPVPQLIHNLKVKVNSDRERPKIMVTGYWPPTNEMVRHFSQDPELNPDGWQGENWEGLGYDVVSFFPQFDPADCNNCGQGFGDLEVDYQDFTQDYWPIVEEVQPVGIITFSRGFNDMSWELENRLVNRINWVDDYTSPLLPTPNPPDSTVVNYYVRYSSLPINDIINAIQNAGLGLEPYLDNTNAGMFLSEFAGYHGVWYKETYDEDVDIPCFAGGHIHVGGQVDWDTAKEAAEVSIRTLIVHVDEFMILSGDCNSDGQVNILDVVAIAGAILGNLELTPNQAAAADMDDNGLLNILDIIAIVNLILTE